MHGAAGHRRGTAGGSSSRSDGATAAGSSIGATNGRGASLPEGVAEVVALKAGSQALGQAPHHAVAVGPSLRVSSAGCSACRRGTTTSLRLRVSPTGSGTPLREPLGASDGAHAQAGLSIQNARRTTR